jgi:hypothetical protein
MIQGWTSCALAASLAFASCGCAMTHGWTARGESRFASQFYAYQRQNVSDCGPACAAQDQAPQATKADSTRMTLAERIQELAGAVTPKRKPIENPAPQIDLAGKTATEQQDAAQHAASELADEQADEAATSDVLALIASLRHDDPGVRALAAFRLGRLDDPSQDVLAALRNTIADEEHGLVRVRMAEAIIRIAPDDATAIQWLSAALSDGDWQVRWLAAGILDAAAGTPAAALAVEQLTIALSDDEPKVRQMAALTLGSFGGDAEPARGPLHDALADDDSSVREAASAATACIVASQATEE